MMAVVGLPKKSVNDDFSSGSGETFTDPAISRWRPGMDSGSTRRMWRAPEAGVS